MNKYFKKLGWRSLFALWAIGLIPAHVLVPLAWIFTGYSLMDYFELSTGIMDKIEDDGQ